MATVRISNIINPTVYGDIISVDRPETAAFYRSGVMIKNDYLNILAQGGTVGDIRYWNDLNAGDEPNYSNDNPADIAVPKNVAMGEMFFRKAYLNQGWAQADLVADLMKRNPMTHIKARTDAYWQEVIQKRLIASLQGVLADNIANDAGDMVNDVSTTLVGDITSANLFSADAVTLAAFSMGVSRNKLAAIAVHPMIKMRMINQDRIDYIQDSKTGLVMERYMGLEVIEDEGLPYTAAEGTGDADDAAKYTSILFGKNSVAWGEGNPLVPVEVERQASQATGGGVETLWERKEWIIHPLGLSFTSNTLTGTSGQSPVVSANYADLKLAANWDRKFDRKLIPFAFIVTNG